MEPYNHYKTYAAAIEKVIQNKEELPSLPSITLKIRQAISDPNNKIQNIVQLIHMDPSLSALLLKHAASPLYKRPVPPKTIDAVLTMIGMPALDNLVMTHSIKSLFILKNPQLKKLFQSTWERMMFKAATCHFLARKFGYRPAERAMSTSILIEIGTLVLLSAFKADAPVPDNATFTSLCRKYSKSLSAIVLNKWGIDKNTIKISHYSGQWNITHNEKFTLIDIINLAIYATVQHQIPDNDLPPIETIESYKKLPRQYQQLTEKKELLLITENISEITAIIGSI